jgi:hypothetical protein
MAGDEPTKKKRRLKHREPADSSFPRGRRAHVVLWDEAPDDDAPEDSEDDQASK